MRRLLAVALVVVLLVGAVPVAPVLGVQTARDVASSPRTPDARSSQVANATAPQATNTSSPQTLQTSPRTLGMQEDFDSAEFHITVYENGTAEWTFTYQRTLHNDSERQQFQAFADEFNNNSTELYRGFRQRARKLASEGQNVTGRTMKAENFGKNAEIGGIVNDNRGIVKMTFQWSSFAYADEEMTVIGDVFVGGLYLGPNQSLVVHAGPGLKFASVDPSDGADPSGESLAASESVTWGGGHDFNDRRPRVMFEPMAGPTTTTTDQDGGNGTNGTTTRNASQPPTDGGNWPPLMMFIGAVVILLGLAAAFAWRQGDFGSLSGDAGTPGGGGGGAAAAETTGGSSPEPSVSDEELLTDEARVKKLLDENGGRMKQVNIVEETGWSKSKVSMLLSEMEDDGDISKLRVGRENIISLEGHEPDAAGSPLEE